MQWPESRYRTRARPLSRWGAPDVQVEKRVKLFSWQSDVWTKIYLISWARSRDSESNLSILSSSVHWNIVRVLGRNKVSHHKSPRLAGILECRYEKYTRYIIHANWPSAVLWTRMAGEDLNFDLGIREGERVQPLWTLWHEPPCHILGVRVRGSLAIISNLWLRWSNWCSPVHKSCVMQIWRASV